VADDVVANGLRAKLRAHLLGSLKNTELTQRVRAVVMTHHAQRACVAQQSQKQFAFGSLVQLGVMRGDACRGQQLGQYHFMLVRALAQVNRGQMKAKDFDGADQGLQALRHQGLGVLCQQGRLDHAQIAQQFLRGQVGVLWRHRMAGGFAPCQCLQGRSQACIHADQGTPVRLVFAVFVTVGRVVG